MRAEVEKLVAPVPDGCPADSDSLPRDVLWSRAHAKPTRIDSAVHAITSDNVAFSMTVVLAQVLGS